MTPYPLIYLGIGAAIMAFVILRTPYDNEPDVMVKMMARKDYSDASDVFENFMIKFVIPLIVCLVTVVAWPAALIFKAQDMWRVRRRHKSQIPSLASTEISSRVLMAIVLLGYDYLCVFNMCFVITIALLAAWLASKTNAILRTCRTSAQIFL
jgi:hypothetical protein